MRSAVKISVLVGAFLLLVAVLPSRASAAVWHSNREASYYYMPGNRTACGQTMSSSSYWVAALKDDLAHCGLKVTICKGRKCVRVRVQDRGAHHTSRRDWDLTPRVKNRLGCGDLCTVRWAKGWWW